MPRAFGAAAFGFLLALVLAGPAGAAGDLIIEAEAVYTVDPPDSRLDLAITYTLTNDKPSVTSEGVTTRFFYDEYRLAVPEDAFDISAGTGERELTVTEAVEEGRRVVTIRLERRIFYRDSTSFTFRFSLPGAAPRTEGPVRVNPAYAAFYASAWGDPGLSDVTIVAPSDMEVTLSGEPMSLTPGDAADSWEANDIESPADWSVLFSGRLDDALVHAEVPADGLTITVSSWPGDAVWSQRVESVVAAGFPVLQEMIGLGLGDRSELEIVETLDPALLGYAGWYLADSDLIEMGEDLVDHVILHEVSHLWFNGALFSERWITEGLADAYSSRVVAAIGGELVPEYDETTRPQASPSRLPLNSWSVPGTPPGGDDDVAAREEYGYDASFYVVDRIIDELGVEGMSEVLAAAAGDFAAYRGEGPAAKVPPDDDWRRFLDLTQVLAGSEKAEALFRLYVVSPEEARLLEERAEARSAHAGLTVADGDWDAPPTILASLESWDFDEAEESIARAHAVVEAWAMVAGGASDLGMIPPVTVEAGYEGADDPADLDATMELVEAQLSALQMAAEARRTLDAPRDSLVRLGLLGERPEASWRRLASAFAADDRAVVRAEAADLIELMANASDVGRTRLIWASGGLVLVVGGTAGATMLLRRRRRETLAA